MPGMRDGFENVLTISSRVCSRRPRAVCGVANPRHSYGYVCGLRLAAHPDPHPAPLRAEIVNTF